MVLLSYHSLHLLYVLPVLSVTVDFVLTCTSYYYAQPIIQSSYTDNYMNIVHFAMCMYNFIREFFLKPIIAKELEGCYKCSALYRVQSSSCSWLFTLHVLLTVLSLLYCYGYYHFKPTVCSLNNSCPLQQCDGRCIYSYQALILWVTSSFVQATVTIEQTYTHFKVIV